jgi:16S rRNA processing protein RimM
MKTEADDLVVMGRIVAPYGILGWVKVKPDTEQLDGLLAYKTWLIGKGTDWLEVKLEKAKVHNDVLHVKLSGVNDRDAAFTCKGKQVAVPKATLPELEDNEYYWSDLIGLEVKNQQGVGFGKVIDVFETGANDVVVVKGEVERLIPFIAQTILEVSLDNQTMLVDWDEDF